MEDLFGTASVINDPAHMPLAARFRPRTLEEYFGQEHLLAVGKPLRRQIEADRISSLIFFGPPGTGKTSLAEVIAHRTKCHFERLNAVEATVQEVRKALASATLRLRTSGERTILFLDELHRFNKAQQDVLLPDVESGNIRLIGATTHNPSFYLTGPLVSRSQIFQLEPLSEASLEALIDRVLHDGERGLGQRVIHIAPEARRHLVNTCEGDARRLLNALEIAALTTVSNEKNEVLIDQETIEACVQRKIVLYDRNEDQHYDTISAFIKSVRGSDPDSALYWLAKMIEAGEDPRFLARRLVILASEDIGIADPRGIMVAVAAQQALEFIGMPEGRIPLAQATVYLATAPKSNAAYVGIDAALDFVKKEKTVLVPKALRDAHYSGARKIGHGQGYEYSHDAPEGISNHGFGIEGVKFYEPTTRGFEKEIGERLARWAEIRKQRRAEK